MEEIRLGIWSEKCGLSLAVCEALPADGAFIAVEALIDNTRHEIGPPLCLNLTGCEPRFECNQGNALN